MITAGMAIAEDPELGLNAGVYRFLVKDRNTTGIDIVTPNNLAEMVLQAKAAENENSANTPGKFGG